MSISVKSIVFLLLAGHGAPLLAQSAPTDVASYLIADRAREIALARSAAPKAISDSAAVMVLTRQGFVQAAPGTNGFVCLVLRAFSGALANVASWQNPRIQAPLCLNPAAVRSELPAMEQRASLVMSGIPAADVVTRTYHAYATHELAMPESGAMAYMMSHDQHLSDEDPAWKSHVMFFYGGGHTGVDWGAGGPDAPIIDGGVDPRIGTNIILIPVRQWSDGTPVTR